MNYRLKRRVYENLPGFLRAPVGWIPFGLIAGRSYRETMRRADTIDGAGREAIAAYQDRHLRELLLFACDQVPAYRRQSFPRTTSSIFFWSSSCNRCIIKTVC